MAYRVKTAREVGDVFLEEACRLDAEAYRHAYAATPERLKARYYANKDTYFLLYDGADKLVGLLNVFPLSDALTQKVFECREVFDDNIEPKDIAPYERGKPLTLLVYSVVVDKTARGTDAVKMLMDAYVDFVKKMIEDGYNIRRTVAYAVSDKGLSTAKKSGFVPYADIGDSIFLIKNHRQI